MLVKTRPIAVGNVCIIWSASGLGGGKMNGEQNYLCFARNVFRESHKERKMGCRNVVHETGN